MGSLDRSMLTFSGLERSPIGSNSPPLAVWLRQAIGDPLVGWKSYGPWAYLEDDAQAAFVLSDTPRMSLKSCESASTGGIKSASTGGIKCLDARVGNETRVSSSVTKMFSDTYHPCETGSDCLASGTPQRSVYKGCT